MFSIKYPQVVSEWSTQYKQSRKTSQELIVTSCKPLCVFTYKIGFPKVLSNNDNDSLMNQSAERSTTIGQRKICLSKCKHQRRLLTEVNAFQESRFSLHKQL